MKRSLIFLLTLLVLVAPVAAQAQSDDCALEALLAPRTHGVALQDIDIHESAGFDTPVTGTHPQGDIFQALKDAQPVCLDGTRWYQIDSMYGWGWIPESIDGEYVIERFVFTPEAPVPFDVPLTQPVITNPDVPLPTIAPQTDMSTINPAFTDWDWAAYSADAWWQSPDPVAMQLPDAYAGDLPVPPVDLSSVYFVQNANLNADQLALLAQNGFVVVPGSYQQFDDAYRRMDDTWDYTTGKAPFVTTDSLLHYLYLAYQNALMFLEMDTFYADVADFLMQGYQAAEAQYHDAIGTPLEAAARSAAVYYAVPLMLIADGESYYLVGYEQRPVYGESKAAPSSVIAAADADIIATAQPLVDLALAGEERESVPFLEDYDEDFSQYKPRSYYAGNPLLESYFRAMMWLGRITFTARSQTDTLTGVLALRALENSGAYANWLHVAETLDFLVGPIDDYSPRDYAPIAENAFGSGLPLDTLTDSARWDTFKAGVDQLPPPRVNSIPLEQGALTEEEMVEQTRGFRLFGQRFTFDGYVMQQLIYPAVGTADMSRTLPLGLDVPAVLGSDEAFALTDAAGATDYLNYTDHVAELRGEVNGMSASDWLENLYGGWLWTLQPLAVRDPALVPPMMQTDAWQRKDLSTFLGSYTELKHATLLYAEQPMGGLGGGGMEPPVVSFGYVEPQPLVFARISIVAGLLDQGLAERGLYGTEYYSPLMSVKSALSTTSRLSALIAEMARKGVAGEPLTYDEAYFLQENFGQQLWYIRYELEEWITNPPENTALIADVASNAAAGTALELAVAEPDTIYVITNSPYGLQVTRGAVYSYYEFTVNIDGRMTDDEWRQQVATDTMPPRPDWVGLYLSE